MKQDRPESFKDAKIEAPARVALKSAACPCSRAGPHWRCAWLPYSTVPKIRRPPTAGARELLVELQQLDVNHTVIDCEENIGNGRIEIRRYRTGGTPAKPLPFIRQIRAVAARRGRQSSNSSHLSESIPRRSCALRA